MTHPSLSRRNLLAAGAAISALPALAQAQTPARGGVLRMSVDQSVGVLNPLLTRVNPEYLVSELLYSGLTRLAPDEKRTLFAPDLKKKLATMKEAVTGLATSPDGTLFVAGPSAILKVKTDGTVTTVVHPVEVKDGDDVFDKYSDSPFFHAPYIRGLDVTEDEAVYAAVTGRRCVVKISKAGKVEAVLTAEKPWAPTGVAVRGNDVFVLEYTHVDKSENWAPRVRKLGADGKISIPVRGKAKAAE
jgi:hypothetical protein